MLFSWLQRKPMTQPGEDVTETVDRDFAAAIVLRVENGLLMAFGPDGDPVPPNLVASACADDPKGTLMLETGGTVARQCVLNVLEAQQKGRLADQPNDAWVKAMLCLDGAFEQTPAESLATEPLSAMPSPRHTGGRTVDAETDDRVTETEIVTPFPFDETERSAMADADMILVHGLAPGTSLSAGRYDPALDGWIISPSEILSLAVQRNETAPRDVEIGIAAITLHGEAKRRPIATKRLELA